MRARYSARSMLWFLRFAVFHRVRVVIFFFSSRRRHTRFDCDWSSDVCSSDLVRFGSRSPTPVPASRRKTMSGSSRSSSRQRSESISAKERALGSRSPSGWWSRSEERRVGKGVDLGGRRIIKKKKKDVGVYDGT